MRIRISLLIAVLSLGAMAQGCGYYACTEKGCLNGPRLVIRSADGSLPEGRYTVRVVTTDVDQTLTCTVGGLAPGAEPCESPSGAIVFASVTDGALDLTVETEADDLEVSVTRDETMLETFSVSPTYTDFRINGEGCEPVCRTANETLTLP